MGATRFRPWLGIANPGGYYSPTASNELAALETLTGVHVDVELAFMDLDFNWNPAHAAALNARGTTVYVTWVMPGSEPDPGVLAAVNAGDYDADIAQKATATMGQDVIVRVFHEMNGNFNVYGQQPVAYLAAWERVRGIFRSHGNMAPFSWTPNITGPNADAFEQYYPGDDLVEYVGLDGYSYSLSGNPSMQDVFGGDFETLVSFADRPLIIGETGRAAIAKDRGRWLTEGLAWLRTVEGMTGFHYWHRDEYAIDSARDGACLGAGMRRWRSSVAGGG